jgi:hypothetical protein
MASPAQTQTVPQSLLQWKTRIIPPSKPDEATHAEYFRLNAETPPSAVLVFHGIGEEVRFETLGRAASFILTEARERGGKDFDIVIRPVPKDIAANALDVRAELSWTEVDAQANTQTKRQVHVYEAYWAPLTAGKVTYVETMLFLVEAGWNGLVGCIHAGSLRKFNRWLFGGFKELDVAAGTLPMLLVLMLVVGFIAAIIAMAASAFAGLAKAASDGADKGIPEAMSFIYGQIAKPWNFILSIFASLLSHVWTGAESALQHGMFALTLSWSRWWEAAIAFAAWGALVWAALKLRTILTSYAGSLVAYLSPYKDSKWEELRANIQQVGLSAGQLILNGHLYSKWIPNYETIVYVAHSLGSVIAYDTLNALINQEAAKQSRYALNPAVQRTRALVTLGSPLNKTAFLFRVQYDAGDLRNGLDQEGALRETMVCAVQPLVTDYDAYRFNAKAPPRRPKWINLWSKSDIISGKLEYYDDPTVLENDLRHVENLVDPEANKFILAHNQYWTGKLLRQKVYEQLF